MGLNLREIIKRIGITQQELADYLGISRQYLNSYLDETLEDPRLPVKYLDNILFLFECKNREELYAENFTRNAKNIRKRMNVVKKTKESIDNLFNIENNKKIELFKMMEYFQNFIKLDEDIIEAFEILLEKITMESSYQALLSYIGKKYLLFDFEDARFNSPENKSREALLYEAFDNPNPDFSLYKDKYEKFVMSVKQDVDIDVEALKKTLADLGYTNISQKEVIDLLKKYNENRKDSKD